MLADAIGQATNAEDTPTAAATSVIAKKECLISIPLLKTYKKPYSVDEKLTFMFRSSFITFVFAIQKDKLLAFDIMLWRL